MGRPLAQAPKAKVKTKPPKRTVSPSVPDIPPAPKAAPVPLYEKYRPLSLDGFVGLESARKLISHFASNPVECAWYFLGESGTGKTSLARVLASVIEGGGELYHIASRHCDLKATDKILHRVQYFPMGGQRWHVILVDEADQMSRPAQLAFLSMLDGTNHCPNTVFVFTANATTGMEKRFMSRCRLIRFDLQSFADTAPGFLADVWRRESGPDPAPDFARVFRLSESNIRTALNNLELLLIDPAYEIVGPEPEPAKPVTIYGADNKPVSPERRAAALKAWETIRRKRNGG